MSIFQRHTDTPADAPAVEPDAVAAARTGARRRLIGAAVLLGLGVVGFPLLFETQPRPVPVNIPIEIPSKDSAPPLLPPPLSPSTGPAPAAARVEVMPPDAEGPLPKPPELVERAADAATVPTPALPRAASAATVAKPAAAASRPAAVPVPVPVPAPAANDTADGARARALLDGPAASAAASRLVVQVGAYTDPAKLRDARQKVEKLGFKTYTQEVEVDGSKRTRVRVGPFADRAEADAAAARIKASGLPVAILTL